MALLRSSRRALTSLSTFTKTLTPSFPSLPPTPPPSLLPSPSPISLTRSFKSSSISLLSARSYNNNNNSDEKLDPNAILFEGCDYNHWLITMEFPKDQEISPEQMVETYVETCAKGLNISIEEAKKRIYACSTTTYQGFQAIMTEAESEQFRGLTGVVFILPDSYIDPVNKEYGGDKYINGTIIPRPPPVQYTRQRRPSGNYGQSNRGGNYPPPSNQQGSMQGERRNYGPPQNFSSQQNYGPPGQGERRDPMPMNNRDFTPGGRGSYQDNYNQGGQGNYPQDRRDFAPSEQRGFRDNRNYAPPQGGQGNYPQDRRDFAPSDQRDFRDNRNYAPPQGGNFAQGQGAGFGQGTGPGLGQVGSFGQGASGTPGQGQGAGFGQGTGSSFGQGSSGTPGQGQSPGFGQGAGGPYGQGSDSGYGANHRGYGEDQRYSQVDQNNYPPMGQTRMDQGR